MKLEREPIEEFDEAIFTKDRQFWREYSKRLIGDWIREDTPVEEICNWIERTYQRHDLSDFKAHTNLSAITMPRKASPNCARPLPACTLGGP